MKLVCEAWSMNFGMKSIVNDPMMLQIMVEGGEETLERNKVR